MFQKIAISMAALSTTLVLAGCSSTAPQPSPTPAATAKRVENKPTLSPVPEPESDMYENDEFSFSVTKPKGWEKQEEVEGTVVVFLSPQEGSDDTYQENVIVAVQALDTPTTLDAYNTSAKKQVAQAVTDGKVIENKKIKLGEQPAYSLVYTGKQGEEEHKWQTVYTQKDNSIYAVTYDATPTTYDKYTKDFETLLSTFQFVESKSGQDGVGE